MKKLRIKDKIEIARDCKTSKIELYKLSFDDNFQVRKEVAKNINSPFEALNQLSTDNNREVRVEVACNK